MLICEPHPIIARTGKRFILGVAVSYSISDLDFLDIVNRRLRTLERQKNRSPVVKLFDVTSIEEENGLELYIPGGRWSNQTPVLGVWDDGKFTESAVGERAKCLVLTELEKSEKQCLGSCRDHDM
jgi:hypothetical protein